MPMNKSPLAYGDCIKVLDRAIQSEKGIRVTFSSNREAVTFRYRLDQARRNDRKMNKEVYNQKDHLYGKSLYDYLCFRVILNEVHLEKVEAREFNISDLENI